MEIEHRDTGKNVALPKRDSKIWFCLMSLVGLKIASTLEVCDSLNGVVENKQTMSEVSSQLTVLRYKGLVEVIDNKKGVSGGSTWQLTTRAKQLTENL